MTLKTLLTCSIKTPAGMIVCVLYDEALCIHFYFLCVCVCVGVNAAGASMGDPRGRSEAQHDGGSAGAVRPQQTSGADRVAPHQQRHPL